MDQGYPLRTYHTHHSNDYELSANATPATTDYSYNWATYQPAYTPIESQPHHRTDPCYQQYGDGNTGHMHPVIQGRHQPKAVSFAKWWLLEIIASCISVGSLVAIVIVLREYDGRSLTEVHLSGSLTLNGVIAALSTLSRVALMFPVGSALSQELWVWLHNNAQQSQECRSRLKDFELSNSASRGAWGSMLLLLFARRRYVAYIGALVTIVSLAFGTFTQQLLVYDQFPVTDHASPLAASSLPRAESWQYYNGNPAEVALTPPFSVRAAIYSGILSNKVDPIVVNCPTGNCTWPITPTLAVCGECSPTSYDQVCDRSVCNYTLPSGSNYSLTNTGDEGIGFVVGSNSGGLFYNATKGDRLYMANFDVLGSSYKSLAQNFNNTNVTASECALWMCIKSYQARMADGKLFENVTREFYDLTHAADNTIGVFDNYTFADLPSEMNPSPDITYNASLIGMVGFGVLRTLINGTAFLDLESSAADSDTVDAVWNASSNLAPWIEQVATSMSNAIRYDDPNPQPPSRRPTVPAPIQSQYIGTSYQLGIRVRWIWLVGPVLCVVLSLLFLVIVMVQTSRSPIAPWKSRLATPLFIDIDSDVKLHAANSRNHWRGLMGAVGDRKIRLREDSGGKMSLKLA